MSKVAFADLPERVFCVHTGTGVAVFNSKYSAGEASRYPEEYERFLSEKAAAKETCLPQKAGGGLRPNQVAAIKILVGIYKRMLAEAAKE